MKVGGTSGGESTRRGLGGVPLGQVVSERDALCGQVGQRSVFLVEKVLPHLVPLLIQGLELR